MATQTMTFGVMPSFHDFRAAFERECPDGVFSVRSGLSRNPMEGEWACSELFAEIMAATEQDDDAKLSECSAILGTLGFEWV